MPSSASSTVGSTANTHAFAAVALRSHHAQNTTHFGVVPFRRDATGAIVPGAAVEVRNGDIAWRRARAEAFDHDNVGAVVLTGSALTSTGLFTDGVLLAQFGEVALDTLAG